MAGFEFIGTSLNHGNYILVRGKAIQTESERQRENKREVDVLVHCN